MPKNAVFVTFGDRLRVCAWLNPPQLLLSISLGVPGVPKANVTDWPAPEIVRSEAELSDAVQEVDVPVRDIVPLNAAPVLLVTVIGDPESSGTFTA